MKEIFWSHIAEMHIMPGGIIAITLMNGTTHEVGRETLLAIIAANR